MSKETVVILQNDMEEALAVETQIKNHFTVLIATDNWERAISSVESHKPAFFITEVTLKQTDGVAVTRLVKAKSPTTHCVAISIIAGGGLVKEIIDAGVQYYMIKPVDYQMLTAKMKSIINNNNNDDNQSSNHKRKTLIDERISRIFIGMGIPPHIKGYGYLREGVKLAVDKPELINSVTKKLYPMIGEMFSTSASKVERAIRHAIEVAWNKGRVDAFNALFGVRAYSENERPTNSEFIALIADRLLLDGVSNLASGR